MKLKRRLRIYWYLLRKVPLILFQGIRVVDETSDACTVVIPRLWRNRNPFGITYFASLISAGEMAAGTMLLGRVVDASEPLYVLIRDTKAEFKRPASGPIKFICSQGMTMDLVVEDVCKTGLTTDIISVSRGYTTSNKLACIVTITWAVRLIRS